MQTSFPFARFRVTPLALGALLSLAACTRCFADAVVPPSDDEKVEACVEQLREAPVHPVDHFMSSVPIGDEKFQRLQVGDRQVSEDFSKCLDEASKAGFSHTLSSRVDHFGYSTRNDDGYLILRARMDDARYVFIDAYQRKYVLDLQDKRSYDLVRIPVPGSIEAMGTWQGTVTPGGGCRNSYGDPCGSKYQWGSTGYSRVDDLIAAPRGKR